MIIAGSLLTATACSSSTSEDGATDEPASTTADGGGASTSTHPVPRPDAPAADLTEELTGGKGAMIASADQTTFSAPGYVEHEFVAAGTAVRYQADGDLATDGQWDLTEGDSADYRTRIVVRRPENADDFNGTVVVEWFNVSGGLDANPDFTFMQEELVRGGYAWVGVSAQHIGIEGGPVLVGVEAGKGIAGRGLKAIDPERYASLSHPGDAYSYDIYTQIARALRTEDSTALGDLTPERILAVGESQSAFALTTYANGVQPLAKQYDGILIHSRGGPAAPLGEPGAGIDLAGSLGGAPTQIRTDLDVPVLILQTEGAVIGLLNYFPARQDDTDHIRLWEVAGSAHADRFLIGDVGNSLNCSAPINNGPQRFVVRAGLRALDTWVRTGEAPPTSERLETTTGPGGAPAYVRDADGIAEGGIRTPVVDVPVDVLSGEPGADSSVVCILFGTTTPIPEERLAQMYPSADEYEAAFEKATDAAIDAGFVLGEDRAELLDMAQPDRLGS